MTPVAKSSSVRPIASPHHAAVRHRSGPGAEYRHRGRHDLPVSVKTCRTTSSFISSSAAQADRSTPSRPVAQVPTGTLDDETGPAHQPLRILRVHSLWRRCPTSSTTLPGAMALRRQRRVRRSRFPVHVGQKPHSRGWRQNAASDKPDPVQLPAKPRKNEAFRACVRLTREIIGCTAMDDFRGTEIQPVEDVRATMKSTLSCAAR